MTQQFIQRIANWIANELITKRLANSPLFIEAAHKLHVNVVQKTQQAASAAGETVAKELAKSRQELLEATRKAQPPSSAAPRPSGFRPSGGAGPTRR